MSGCFIDNTFTLMNNFNDWLAEVQKKPMAPQRLHVFFQKGSLGPHKYQQWKSTKCKELDVAVAVASKKFSDSQQALLAPAASLATTVALNDLKSEKKRQSLAKARVAAVNTLKAKQGRRVMKLG